MHDHLVAIILGGGKGTRLFPLTEERAKPAVAFGGKYRLVDIPISNCINAGVRKIYILTQFNSASLHIHLNETYQFDSFSGGFVQILAAEQTPRHEGWYNGTADAVRKNFAHFHPQDPNAYLILSGDQLYRMDVNTFYNSHKESNSEVSIAATPVTRETAHDLGIVKIDSQGRIIDFFEKPGLTADITAWEMPVAYRKKHNISEDKKYLASMGMYIFNCGTLESCLDNNKTDFGKEVIPEAIKNLKVNAFIYTGYWEDIGTIKSFYEANINLASAYPDFDMYDAQQPLYTRKLNLPPSKLNRCVITTSLSAEGSIITGGTLQNSIVGMRSLIETETNLDGVVCLGADFYETDEQKAQNKQHGIPNVGIGANTKIRRAIIDKNARIGENCSIGMNDTPPEDGDYGSYMVVDGIIIIRKNALIPNNSVI